MKKKEGKHLGAQREVPQWAAATIGGAAKQKKKKGNMERKNRLRRGGVVLSVCA